MVNIIIIVETRLRGNKDFPRSTQLNMIFPLIYVKMPTVVAFLTFSPLKYVKMPSNIGILTFSSRKNSIIGLYEHDKAEFLDIFILMCI